MLLLPPSLVRMGAVCISTVFLIDELLWGVQPACRLSLVLLEFVSQWNLQVM